MYNPSTDSRDVLCPECLRVMVQLADYAETPDIGPGINNDNMMWPNPTVGELTFGFALVDWMVESVSSAIRRVRLRGICRRDLATFPGSLICPSCLHLLRRK